MSLLPLLAEAATPDWTQTLINTSVSGAIILWFTTQNNARMKANENATNRMTRAVLLLVVSLRTANDSAKGEARSILKEIDSEGEKGGE